ncbi:hypothetical protein H0H93_000129 [Arthromyces matolae]|nr:hypothetical protein H0H93_000129 [Arthromyces matolae]
MPVTVGCPAAQINYDHVYVSSMFSSLGLFQSLACPEGLQCSRQRCIFSHRPNLPPQLSLSIPLKSSPKSAVPSKRVISSPTTVASTSEPPRKVQKLAPPPQRPLPPSKIHDGVPILNVNAAHSQVAVPVRQAMLKTLYDQFFVLYKSILPKKPSLAAEHALKQEEEVYKKSSKLTYRNAAISCAGAIKRRPIPDSISHDSVGTEAELTARAEARKSRQALRLARDHLESYLMSKEALVTWGYFIDVPDGPGGTEPSLEGKVAKCERCTQPFLVKRKEEADECIYHWGKPLRMKVGGEKTRIYSCCSRPVADSEGCTHGPHVFYESYIEESYI